MTGGGGALVVAIVVKQQLRRWWVQNQTDVRVRCLNPVTGVNDEGSMKMMSWWCRWWVGDFEGGNVIRAWEKIREFWSVNELMNWGFWHVGCHVIAFWQMGWTCHQGFNGVTTQLVMDWERKEGQSRSGKKWFLWSGFWLVLQVFIVFCPSRGGIGFAGSRSAKGPGMIFQRNRNLVRTWWLCTTRSGSVLGKPGHIFPPLNPIM